jgi:general secretion pathway protein F
VTAYTYKAVDSSGAFHSGQLTGVTRASVIEALSRRGLVPLTIDEGSTAVGDTSQAPIGPNWWSRGYLRPTHARPQEILSLTQSLTSLLKAGLTIDRALQISASLAPRPPLQKLADALLKSVRAGKTLSGALTACRQPLPPYYISMVEAGEAGGSLPDTLARLVDLMTRQMQMRERIRSALIYPSLLAGVVLVTLIVLLVVVLPRFEVLFADSEVQLPWSTELVLRLGRLTADYWWLMLLVLTTSLMGLSTWLKSNAGRLRFHRWLLRTRLALGLPGALDTARLLRTVSSLLKNGLPLPVALRVSRGTLTNQYLLHALSTITHQVQAGEGFSVAFGRADCFPPVAIQLARVGEETGTLDDMLQSAAVALEEEAHRLLERLLSLVVPLLTITMGVMVAALISSVLIGLLSINDLAF